MYKKYFLFFIILFLSGCRQEIHSVEKFVKDKDLTMSFIEKCEKEEINSNCENCVNARRAKMTIDMEESMKNYNTKF